MNLTNPVYENNLAALRMQSPEIALEIDAVGFQGLSIEIVPTKTAAPSARVTPPHGDKPILLHSAYDPIREAARWAESIEFTQPTNVIVMGFGLGYHILSLLALHDKNIRHLVIVENDLRIFRLALSAVDLRRVLNRRGSHLVLAASPDTFAEILKDIRTDIILHNFKILLHEPSVKLEPDYYPQANKTLLNIMTHDEVNLRTTFEGGGRNQFNIFMNLPAMAKGYALKDCEGLFTGWPAIVAAAGPSLDKNIAELREIGDRAALFTVDTAQRTFRKYGLAPDVVVTGDPTPLNFSHFESIDSMGEAFLAFHPEVNRQITQKFIHHPYLLPLFDQEGAVLNSLFDLDHEYGRMIRAMNVGHLAFNLARLMGCGPIVLVGFDFAFPRHGGTTHAADAALSREVKPMQRDGTVDIGGKEGKACEESGKMTLVDGYYGEPVPTTVPFVQYIHALEDTVAQCPFEVIDATEGGAAFKGTLRMPLREALPRVLSRPGVGQRWAELKQKRRQADVPALMVELRKGRDVLAQSRRTCDTLMHFVIEWRAALQRGTVEWDYVHRQWNSFDEIWVDMVGQKVFNDFLGTAVQYLYFVRQRQTPVEDDSARAYLKSVVEKYDYIVREMAALLDSFAQTVDLAIMSLEAGLGSRKE